MRTTLAMFLLLFGCANLKKSITGQLDSTAPGGPAPIQVGNKMRVLAVGGWQPLSGN